jgi:hypothetical protein
MTLLWLATGAALAAALMAWSRARRANRRLEQLSGMYWELRYQYELRVEVQRMSRGEPVPDARLPVAPRSTDAFVPLSSLKR